MVDNIRNIIFDYGNVIFEIDFKRAQEAFGNLGIDNIETFFAHKGHHPLFDNFETGSISESQFRKGIRMAAKNYALSDTEIDKAWNSLLIGVPSQNHGLLTELKSAYRTFLLSNNNEIHYNWILKYLQEDFQLNGFDTLFEKAWFSHQMGLRKPDPAIFFRILKTHDLNPEETLFIDDSPQHIEGAEKAGLHTLLMDRHPSRLGDFLKEKGYL